MRCLAIVALVGMSLAGLARGQVNSDAVSQELKRYYADGENLPAWKAAVEKLASDNAVARCRATSYLQELLGQALKDEQSGVAPWHATPYWGRSGENPARELRKDIAGALATAKGSVETLPLIEWFVDTEPLPDLQVEVMSALAKLDGEGASRLRAALATKPHRNSLVVVEALKQITSKKAALPNDQLQPLCQHYRASVREAARQLNRQQRGPEPPAFDAVATVKSEPIRDLMKKIDSFMIDMPKQDVRYVEMTVRFLDEKKKEQQRYKTHGWVVQQQKDSITIWTLGATPVTLRDGKQTKITKSKPTANGATSWQIDVTQRVDVAAGEIKDDVVEIEKIRAAGNKDYQLSREGGLTGQFEGRGASLREMVLATWLYRAKRFDLAARILLPTLDTVYTDQDLIEMVKHQLGTIHGKRMLVAFVGDRDYEQTLKLAEALDKNFPDTRFHAYAQELARQLPKRMDDFKTLKLPTPDEWNAMKRKLTREQQIDFLCQRMRLLNYFQVMQPGGYFPGATQYAEPSGMAPDASWGLGRGKTEVINPETELSGEQNWHEDDKPRPTGMNLTLKDVPQISKYLREDWYMHTVTFWRDFHPNRYLHPTRPEFAGIINGLALKDICEIGDWENLAPAEIDKQIDRINRWAKANEHKTTIQLEWDALDEEIAAGGDWQDIEGRVDSLLEQKQEKAFDVMERYLERKDIGVHGQYRILERYLEHDAERAKKIALRYVDHPEFSVRFRAGMIAFKTGSRDRARKPLGDGLAEQEINSWIVEAVELLLTDGSAESRSEVARLFSNPNLRKHQYGSRPKALSLCAKAGMKEPYLFYLPLLDNNTSQMPLFDENGKSIGTAFCNPTVAEEFAREIVAEFASDEPGVKAIVKKHPKTADQIPHLKTWLKSQAASAR